MLGSVETPKVVERKAIIPPARSTSPPLFGLPHDINPPMSPRTDPTNNPNINQRNLDSGSPPTIADNRIAMKRIYIEDPIPKKPPITPSKGGTILGVRKPESESP